MKKLSSMLVVCLLSLGLASCSTMRDEDVGLLAGGVAGGAIGSAVSGGNTAATIGGAVVGGALGREVVRNRDY